MMTAAALVAVPFVVALVIALAGARARLNRVLADDADLEA